MNNRYLCWDDSLIEKSSNIDIIMHKPIKKNIALFCDLEWEGNCNGYGGVIKVGDTYRLYYRGLGYYEAVADGYGQRYGGVFCVAESKDGINFRKPNLQIYNYNGTKNNNIVLMRENDIIDNFAVFYDANPNCPEDERYKALAGEAGDRLAYYACADGYRFEHKYDIDVKGAFDSFNIGAWDEVREEYVIYYRAFHTKDGVDKFSWVNDKIHPTEDIRDVRMATSKDFKTWVEHGRIKFALDKEDYPLYTSQITKYYRSDNAYIGFPARYFDRPEIYKNFDYMPLGDRHKVISEKFGREGTSFTDCIIMTSFDGINFNRHDEAFLTPGIEGRNNWWYGNCYLAHGLAETESDVEGEPNEISIYAFDNYRITNANLRRYTVRLDGFFSWFGGYNKGEILTKPIKILGENMFANFGTSAAGGVVFTVCDLDGNELEGYKSYTLFGDNTKRPVVFEKELTDLVGNEVRFKIELKDAHLYSFNFE